MPAHIAHLIVDGIVLGRQYPEVHKYMDSMQPYMQSNHRQYLHDMATVAEIAAIDDGRGMVGVPAPGTGQHQRYRGTREIRAGTISNVKWVILRWKMKKQKKNVKCATWNQS